jgi:hypothetical protein
MKFYTLFQIIDISAQKKAEQLKKRIQKCRPFEASTQVALIETDKIILFVTFNKGAENL